MTFECNPSDLLKPMTKVEEKKFLKEVGEVIGEIEREQREGKKVQQPIKKCPFCGRPMEKE